VPLARWFRGPMRQRAREALLGERLASTGIFNTAFLRELLQKHQSGSRDYSAAIWSLVMFDAFLANAMGVEDSPRVALAS